MASSVLLSLYWIAKPPEVVAIVLQSSCMFGENASVCVVVNDEPSPHLAVQCLLHGKALPEPFNAQQAKRMVASKSRLSNGALSHCIGVIGVRQSTDFGSNWARNFQNWCPCWVVDM
eukprot:1101517-Amphidinium_carterae.1